jgi:hypothetical protein
MFLGPGYLLQEAFSDPLRAQAVGLIAGAFILALATMMLYFIFSSRPGTGAEKGVDGAGQLHRSLMSWPVRELRWDLRRRLRCQLNRRRKKTAEDCLYLRSPGVESGDNNGYALGMAAK